MADVWRTKEFYFCVYLFLINVYAFFTMAFDKHQSKKGGWRIRERLFFITAILGGSVGIMIAMLIFHHKTQHKSFYLGIPFLYLIHVVVIFSIFVRRPFY